MSGSDRLALRALGGCREQGRSCFLLEAGGRSWMLDCGVKRAVRGKELGEYPLLEGVDLRRLEAVVLSHAHEDHSAALPLLYKLGFEGLVWCTPPTARMASEYCRGWLRSAERHGAAVPYAAADIARIRFAECGYGETLDLGIAITLVPAGHLLGAASCRIEREGRRVLYTGDMASGSPLLPDPASGWEAESLVVDGSYGARRIGPGWGDEELLRIIGEAAAAGGSVLLPLPRYGRTQELLARLSERASGLPPIFVEEGIREASEECLALRHWFRPGGAERLERALGSGAFRYVSIERGDRGALRDAPSVILAADAMLVGGASIEYFKALAPGPANAAVFTGHSAEGTVGARVLGGERELDTPAGRLRLELRVATAPLRAHPELAENLALAGRSTRRAVIAHCDPRAGEELAEAYRALGVEASAPVTGASVDLL